MNRHDSKAHLETIWDALEAYRADLIPEGDSQYDEIWSDLCTAMAWIREDLGVEEEVNDDLGTYHVEVPSALLKGEKS
jgi:hypothetical protein